jgi:hypothetical protein
MTAIAVSLMQGQAAELISELPYTAVTAECWLYRKATLGTICAAAYKPEIITLSRYIY